MTWGNSGVPAPAWLYTRGPESVRIEVRELGHAMQLLVFGPKSRRRAYDFPDIGTLVEHHTAYEHHLVTQGFTLHEFVSDRRTSPRARPRLAPTLRDGHLR